MTTPRRDFLGMLGAGGLAATGSIHLPGMEGGDPYVKSDKWDMGWIKRINGKARGVFDIVATANSGGWPRVAMWYDQAVEVYGSAKDVSAVAVIRHGGITLAANDAYWEEFRPGSGGGGRGRGGGAAPVDTTAASAPAAAPAAPMRNPIATPKPGATSDTKVGTVTEFIAAGGIVLACNMAFSFSIKTNVARAKNLTGDAAEAAARAYLIPGVILMPSGVFALIAAQQAGCGVCGALVPSMTGAS